MLPDFGNRQKTVSKKITLLLTTALYFAITNSPWDSVCLKNWHQILTVCVEAKMKVQITGGFSPAGGGNMKVDPPDIIHTLESEIA